MIGAVTAGAEMLAVGQNHYIADAGTVLRLNPTEAHRNATVGTEMLRYSVLYIPKSVVASFIDAEASLPRFRSSVTREDGLFHTVCAVHATLSSEVSGQLEQESALSALVQAVAFDEICEKDEHRIPHAAAEEIRLFIDQHYAGAFGLHDLSKLTGLSTFHLARLFKKKFGLSPLAYRDQLRMVDARHRLLNGQSISQIGLELGYADQSHFTRQFQRVVGTSPQRYARGTVS